MHAPQQQTIAQPATVSGFGLFGGVDCTLTFHPAPVNYGISFLRTDLPFAKPIPATTRFVAKAPRRTVIAHESSTVETVEHVMAALAGLQIDNCLVTLDGPEPPIGDGSAWHFVEALLKAGLEPQSSPVYSACVHSELCLEADGGQKAIAQPGSSFFIRYELDYGAGAVVPQQQVEFVVTPETFVQEIAAARTFVLASEIEGLQRMGYGRRATTDNLLVFDTAGVRDNTLRWPDECARHKLLDAIGDLALCGARSVGRFLLRKTGHHINQQVANQLLKPSLPSQASVTRRAA